MSKDKQRDATRSKIGQGEAGDNVIRVDFSRHRKEPVLLATVTRYLRVHEQLGSVERRARWGLPGAPYGK